MEEFREQSKSSGKKVNKITNKVFKYGDNEFFNAQPGTARQERGETSNEEDLVEEIFKEINPLGRPVGDVKKSLENEVKELEEDIQNLKEELGDESKKLIVENKKKILGKNWWIMKIDDFLTDKDIGNLRDTNPNLN